MQSQGMIGSKVTRKHEDQGANSYYNALVSGKRPLPPEEGEEMMGCYGSCSRRSADQLFPEYGIK